MVTSAAGVQDREREARAIRRLARSFRSIDSYGLVLLMIVATYVLAASLTQRWGATVVLVVQIGAVGLALRTSRARRGFRRVAMGLFVLATAAAVANLHPTPGAETLVPYVFLTASVLYIVAPFSIVHHVGPAATASTRRRSSARCVPYTLIGMAFAFAYTFLGGHNAEARRSSAPTGTAPSPTTFFFSFITLTTTGYGNLVPAGNPGQSLAVLEALVGQLFLVTAVGKVVSVWRPQGLATVRTGLAGYRGRRTPPMRVALAMQVMRTGACGLPSVRGMDVELVFVREVRLDVEHHLPHRAGEGEGLVALVASVDDAAVVPSDVHPRIAREPDRHRVVHAALADRSAVDEQGHVGRWRACPVGPNSMRTVTSPVGRSSSATCVKTSTPIIE